MSFATIQFGLQVFGGALRKDSKKQIAENSDLPTPIEDRRWFT
jgi:hypothetical protein